MNISGTLLLNSVNIESTINTLINDKAPISNPTFTGSVRTSSLLLNNVDVQGVLDTLTTDKAPIANPTFTGSVRTTSLLLNNVGVQGVLDTLITDKAPIANPTFTGSVRTNSLLLNNVDVQGVLDTLSTDKAPIANPTFTGTISMSNNKITNVGTPLSNNDCVTKLYSDTATLLNTTNLDNHKLMMASWKEYSSTEDSYIYTKPSLLSTIENDTNTTSVVLDNVGTYRASFNAQFNVGVSCDCAAELQNLVTTIEGKAFNNHVTLYGNNEILVPGNYTYVGATSHNGILYLNGQGNADSVFIFYTTAAHSLGAGASIVLQNSAQASNVFWLCVGTLTIGAGCSIHGTYISKVAITATDPLSFVGRLFSTTAAVTLPNITASVPVQIGVPPIDIGYLANLLIYTPAGNISATSYTSNTLLKYQVKTTVGVITGFGIYNNTYPLSMPYYNVSFAIYQGNTIISSSLVYINTNSLGDNYSVNTACNIIVNTVPDKTISIKLQVLSIEGGFTVTNRTLFVMPLLT
jgi:hypothetical protein